MSGIYVHIPFCKQACTYCDFHFSTQLKHQDDLCEALCIEIATRVGELTTPIQSIYFGGGSPSIVSDKNLQKIFDQLRKSFDLSELKEVTLESNPDDHSEAKLQFWRTLGINRLSIGIQSFIERDLTFMNRAHNSTEALNCVAMAHEAGFEHLTIDLIYGIPNQSLEEWKANIEYAIASGVNHISAYCLTVESKTALAHLIDTDQIQEKSDEEIEAEYLLLHRTLEEAGFDHYEISNFAKSGSKAVHNSNYWKSAEYLGLGPSAHSFDGKSTRRWNASNNAVYIKSIRNKQDYWESETLSEKERVNEEIMTGLRRKIGVNYQSFPAECQSAFRKNLDEIAPQLKEKLILTVTSVSIKPESWLMADAIIRDLIID